jgi:hypothetical protein
VEVACGSLRMELAAIEAFHNITEASQITPKVEEALMGVEDSNSFTGLNGYKSFMALKLEEE